MGYSPWGHTQLNMTGHTHTLVRHVGELSEPGISLMSFPAADAKRGNVWMQGHMHKKIKGSSRRNSRGTQLTSGCAETLKVVSLGCFLSFGKLMPLKLLNTPLTVGISDAAEVPAFAWALCLFGGSLLCGVWPRPTQARGHRAPGTRSGPGPPHCGSGRRGLEVGRGGGPEPGFFLGGRRRGRVSECIQHVGLAHSGFAFVNLVFIRKWQTPRGRSSCLALGEQAGSWWELQRQTVHVVLIKVLFQRTSPPGGSPCGLYSHLWVRRLHSRRKSGDH